MDKIRSTLRIKIIGHTDTLTEASNLIDELYKKGEIQTQEQYKNNIKNALQ